MGREVTQRVNLHTREQVGERIPHIISAALATTLRWSVTASTTKPLIRALGHSLTHILSNQVPRFVSS